MNITHWAWRSNVCLRLHFLAIAKNISYNISNDLSGKYNQGELYIDKQLVILGKIKLLVKLKVNKKIQ